MNWKKPYGPEIFPGFRETGPKDNTFCKRRIVNPSAQALSIVLEPNKNEKIFCVSISAPKYSFNWIKCFHVFKCFSDCSAKNSRARGLIIKCIFGGNNSFQSDFFSVNCMTTVCIRARAAQGADYGTDVLLIRTERSEVLTKKRCSPNAVSRASFE